MDAGGQRDSRDFTDIDNGWDFYQMLKKGITAYNVSWDHIHPEWGEK